jgi:acetyl esterase
MIIRGSKRRRPLRILAWMLGTVALLAALVWLTFQLSPWPAALMIRSVFDRDGARMAQALEQYVPADVVAQRDLRYDPDDSDALLDVYYPARLKGSDAALTTVVWVHGGGWVSGSKESVGNYARILAGRGFTVVAVGYSIAPGKIYPTPVRQVNTALGYLQQHAARLHVDPERLVLAGDSAGAQIAAQLANVVSVPDYARDVGVKPTIDRSQLRGVLLYCGPYDLKEANFDGPFGGFMRTVLWSYSGRRDFAGDAAFAWSSVARYVDAEFPPAFISAGNGDPLEPQSKELASVLTRHGVQVETLFFPPGYVPALPHEYQFVLDNPAGRLALERSAAFLHRLADPEPAASAPGAM